MLVMLVLYAIILIRLNRKGTSVELRRMVVKRYIVYFFLYQLTALGVLKD